MPWVLGESLHLCPSGGAGAARVLWVRLRKQRQQHTGGFQLPDKGACCFQGISRGRAQVAGYWGRRVGALPCEDGLRGRLLPSELPGELVCSDLDVETGLQGDLPLWEKSVHFGLLSCWLKLTDAWFSLPGHQSFLF